MFLPPDFSWSTGAFRVTFSFTITGAPRTKKNSGQMVPARASDGRPFVRVVPSEAYRAWNKAAQPQLLLAKKKLNGHVPINVSVNVAAAFYREAKAGDAVGYYQALADALEEAGIVVNDRLVEQWDGSRLLKDAVNPRIEVTITTLAEEQGRIL
jgi:Holliday junction resolvase RusA-like endonuclease